MSKKNKGRTARRIVDNMIDDLRADAPGEEIESLESDSEILELDLDNVDVDLSSSASSSLDRQDTEEKTVAIANQISDGSSVENSEQSVVDERTVAVAGIAKAIQSGEKDRPAVKANVSYGSVRAPARTGAATAMTSPEATFLQAENLRIAQSRILELEKELEKVRTENEDLAAAGETMRVRADELQIRLNQSDTDRKESAETFEAEIHMLKNSLQYKDIENRQLKAKVEELEGRLSSDLKKIRLRERELENRLELLRMEKSALLQSKDEALLDLKRKMDQLKTECDNYRNKCQELNRTIEQNQEQFRRTVRALRLALTNLEVGENTVVPLKKAD